MLRVSLIGNLGADPELRYTPEGSPVLTFRVAANYRDRRTENGRGTLWLRVVAFGQRAMTLNDFLARGRRVYVEGRLQPETYTDAQGIQRQAFTVVASLVLPVERLPAPAAEGDDAETPDEDLPF